MSQRNQQRVNCSEYDDRRDPTHNVMTLVALSIKCLEDAMNAKLDRVDEKMLMHVKHGNEVAKLESERVDTAVNHVQRITENEIKRIDANQDKSIKDVALAAEKTSEANAILATAVQVKADANTALVLTTAAETTRASAADKAEFSKRLGALELAQGENKGKSGITTPLIVGIALACGSGFTGAAFGVYQLLKH